MTGTAFPWTPAGLVPADALGVPAAMVGKSPDASPAAMTELRTLLKAGMPLRPGIGPSGSVIPGDVVPEAPAEAAGAEETVTVSAADGGVHLTVVATLAVAVNVTEVTELAIDGTTICA